MTYRVRFNSLMDKAKQIAQMRPLLNPRLNKLAPLFFITDPSRTPCPEDIAPRLPKGCGIIYRHFGEADAYNRAIRLITIAKTYHLSLFIGDDVELAINIGAHGVHFSEKNMSHAKALRLQSPDLIITAARHDYNQLGSQSEAGVDALFISPVFKSNSPSAQGIQGLDLSGVKRFVEKSTLPLFGLGGIDQRNIGQLIGSGLSGVGAVDAFCS